MTREEINTKLKAYITCLKCEVSGKCCDDNCPTQYEAGNMSEIIENLEIILKILEDESRMRWIPINESEPNAGEEVLVCDIYEDIYYTWKTGTSGMYFDEYGNKIKDIVAWMPLPKPYKKRK